MELHGRRSSLVSLAPPFSFQSRRDYLATPTLLSISRHAFSCYRPWFTGALQIRISLERLRLHCQRRPAVAPSLPLSPVDQDLDPRLGPSDHFIARYRTCPHCDRTLSGFPPLHQLVPVAPTLGLRLPQLGKKIMSTERAALVDSIKSWTV